MLSTPTGLLDYAISMRPDYHQAIIDTIRFYGWKKVIYIYDSHDGKFGNEGDEEDDGQWFVSNFYCVEPATRRNSFNKI